MPYPFPYLHFHALCAILVFTAVAAASIAIWAGTSSQHWFVRALALWAAAVAPIPMRGYEVAGILAITLPLIALAVLLIQRLWQPRQDGGTARLGLPLVRFGLRDIFLLTLGTALVVAAVLHWWRDIAKLGPPSAREWGALLVNFGLAGTAFFTFTLLAWITVTGRRFTGALALIAAIALFAFAIPIVGKTTIFGVRFDSLPLWQALGLTFRPGPLGPAPFILALVFTEFAVTLLLTLVITKRLTPSLLITHLPPLRTPHSAFRTCQRSPLTCTILAAPLLLLAIIYVKMIWLTPLPPRFSNASNNYDRLIEIMRESERLSKPPVTPASQQQLSALIEEAAALLQADNYIPYDPVKDVATKNRLNHYFVDHHNRLRLFGKRIDDETAAALSRGDSEKALEYALANIRLGLMLQRGATSFDVMFGNGVHFLAQKRLAGLRRELPPDDARRVIHATKDAINLAEDAAAVRTRTRAFSERTGGWSSRLHHVIEDFGLGGIGMDDATYLRGWIERRGAAYRLLQTDLALRLYHRDHGSWPQDLNQLVPVYLSELPIDPHSGRPFIYSPRSDDFLLYSVGKDGIDNGGRFTNSAAYARAVGGSTETHGYDFELDALTRP